MKSKKMARQVIELNHDAVGNEIQVGEIYGYSVRNSGGSVYNYRFICTGFLPSMDFYLHPRLDGYECHDGEYVHGQNHDHFISIVKEHVIPDGASLWPISKADQEKDPCCLALKDYVARFIGKLLAREKHVEDD